MRNCWLRACTDIPELCFHHFYWALKIFVHCESAIFLKEGGVIFLQQGRQKFQSTKNTGKSKFHSFCFQTSINWKCPWTLPLIGRWGSSTAQCFLVQGWHYSLVRWTQEGEKSSHAHVSRHNWDSATLGRIRRRWFCVLLYYFTKGGNSEPIDIQWQSSLTSYGTLIVKLLHSHVRGKVIKKISD